MPRIWTEEQRKAAAERIRQHQPWKHSTGPKSEAGKMRSSMNAIRHGERSYVADIKMARVALDLHRTFLQLLIGAMNISYLRRKQFFIANELIERRKNSKR